MSDVSSGARAPDGSYGDRPDTPAVDPGYPAQTYPTETYQSETYRTETYPGGTYPAETYPATTGTSSDDDSKAKQVAGQAKDAAGQAAGDVKDTAKEQAQRVGSEARTQVRNVASDVRDRVGQQARTQNDKLVSGIRQAADQLEEMRGDRQDSPAATVVSRIADSGRQFADYLDHHGPDGVLREVQDFARRRPGAFLATALAAGFVVGRLGKGIAKADEGTTSGKPSSDSFVSGTGTGYTTGGPGYTGGTGYATAGTEYATGGTEYATGGTGYATGGTGYATGERYEAGTAGYAEPGQSGTNAGYPAGATSSTEYAATGTGTPVPVDEDYLVQNPEDRR